MPNSIEICIANHRLVPVVSLADRSLAHRLAESLIEGGLPVAEITLRTDHALDAIREVSELEGITVGAGTVLNRTQAEMAVDAGAKFIVSPGLDEGVVEYCQATDTLVLPGVATATELQRAYNMGLRIVKFFPAEANGGAPALKAIGAPIPQVKFCPTGGVSLANAPTYLGLSNTLCVGGSWVAPKDKVAARDWAGITALAAEAAALPRT